MVEIRVAVDEGSGVHGLMRRLAALFGRSAISFDRSHNEVRVESEWESRAICWSPRRRRGLDRRGGWNRRDAVDRRELLPGGGPQQHGARFELVIPLRAPERDKAHRSR